MTATTRIIATLTGRVQAVGYRDYTLSIARRFAVAGTVRNLREGGVEIDVEGEPSELDAFLDTLISETRPPARIDHVQRTNAQPRGATRFTRR